MAMGHRDVVVLRRTEERRNRVVHVRFSDPEITDIERAAEEAGLTLSAFMRSLTLEGAGIRPFFTDEDRFVLGLLLADMQAIGVNLNQIARIANRSGRPDARAMSLQLTDIQKVIAALLLELRTFASHGGQRRRGAI